MKKKKKTIVICDDTQKNLDAAKNAAQEFLGKYEFVFTDSAARACELASNPDVVGVVTDLMFPDANGCEVHKEFNTPRNEVWGKLSRSHSRTSETAGIKEFFQGRNNSLDEILSNTDRILAESPLKPYGMSVFMTYLYSGYGDKKAVLITNMHRHGNGTLGSLDAVAVLLPFFEAWLMSFEEVRTNGHASLTYIGGAQKEKPEVWACAIHKLCVQFGDQSYDR